MASPSKKKRNPWGDDSPEKTEDSHLLDWKQQLGGLADMFAPGNFIEELLGGHEAPPEQQAEKQARREVTLFTREMHQQIEASKGELHQETRQVLQELKQQVKMLEKAEKGLSAEIAKISVDQMPAKQGIYYLRYFEWLIGIVRQLRMKVEQGSTWLQQFNGKKQKKGYWQQFKKHGTSFGMSNERSLATSAG